MTASAFRYRDERGLRASITRHQQPTETPRMRDRPILMSGTMVRATLRDLDPKTQTRRAIKPQPEWERPEPCCSTTSEGWQGPIDYGTWAECADPEMDFRRCPYGGPGDRLWVREEFSGPWALQGEPPRQWGHHASIWYWADGHPADGDWTKPKPSIHMPRWASRITLEITGVRVERLNDCSEDDALAEGIACENVIVGAHCAAGHHVEETADRYFWGGGDDDGYDDAISAYAALWDHINGPGSWDANPWVWVIAFKRVTP